MLMHLKFCFESIPTDRTPAAMLRYYRQRKGLTTRQLAENVGNGLFVLKSDFLRILHHYRFSKAKPIRRSD